MALAWNIITSETDFEQSELLNDNIILHYKEIKRPTLAVNKCKSFINEIKVGDIVFTIKEAYSWLSSNYLWFVAIAVVIGGGKFLTVEPPGISKIVKDFISIKAEKEKTNAELTGIKLENYNKAFELNKKMQESEVSLSELENLIEPIKTLSNYSHTMQIKKTQLLLY